MSQELIEKISVLLGVEPHYFDMWGNRHEPSLHVRKSVISAMGFNIETDLDVKRLYDELKTPDFVPPVVLSTQGGSSALFEVKVPRNIFESSGPKKLSWRVCDERGRYEVNELDSEPDRWITSGVEQYAVYEIRDRKERLMGYYYFEFDFAGCLSGESMLIVAPEKCFLNPGAERSWGVTLNLYALRSEKNWGIGDLGDLREAAGWAASLGADFVGLNPLHAIPNMPEQGVSPYSPISRLYRNYIYIDMSRAPFVDEADFALQIARLRDTEYIDYEAVSALKCEALRASYDQFVQNGDEDDRKELSAYKASEGGALEHFALYMAIARHYGYNWPQWPEDLHDPKGAKAEEFLKEHALEVDFEMYLQWLMDRQLRAIQSFCLKSGMSIGLYYDLAVGSTAGGSDAWGRFGVLAIGVDAGAPPDDFNRLGQKWGFPPITPENLRRSKYELLIDTIRKNVRHGGLIRIDHALGLYRMYWAPSGLKASDGVFVRYPFEEILGIIALESIRAGAMIVGEDLGTIVPEVREALSKKAMLSYRLFYFERNYPDPSYLAPENYPEAAFTAVTTHDLPTLPGYWMGRDIEVKKSIGLYPEPEMADVDLYNRHRDLWLIIRALKEHGMISEDFNEKIDELPTLPKEVLIGVYAYLAATPSRLVALSLDDLLGAVEQANMPGTVSEHPNWRRKSPGTVEELSSMGGALSQAIAACRQG